MTTLTDDFNSGTAGDDIATRTGWSTFGSNYDVQVSNANGVTGTNSPAGSDRGGAAFDTGSPDHYSSATYVTLTANRIGLGVRMIDGSNWVAADSQGTGASGLRIYKRVSGLRTDLTTEQAVAGNKYRLEVTANGSSSDYELFEDSGSGWTSMPDGPVSILHTEISGTEQKAGLINEGSNLALSVTIWDDYDGGSLGAAGTTPKGVFGAPLSRPMRGPL